MNLDIVILAAGKGSRMCSNRPKVLSNLGGKPLLEHVIKTAQSLNPKKIHVVYGNGGDLVREHLNKYDVNWTEQKETLGTGHAVMQALPHIEKKSEVLILYGDVPLITNSTLKSLIENKSPNGLGLLSAIFSDPTGFGRIIRNNKGDVEAIIEHKDASDTQKEVKEINTGILITSATILNKYLPKLQKNNSQEEYYLTDIVSILKNDNHSINCLLAADSKEISGINDQKQLATAERIYQKRAADHLMTQGLNLVDPLRFDIRGDLAIGNDITIDINTIIEGDVVIGSNTTIGPNNFLKNVRLGENVVIKPNCVIENTIIEDNCIVGPFARLRPDSHLKEGVRIGNFVEVKKSTIGKNSKASHLSYLGDSIIGRDVNIGAGTITCNYDGANKHKTIIKDDASIGANTSLVAPIIVEEGATIGAGSVITTDAPKDKLTLARAKQKTIEDWQRKKQ